MIQLVADSSADLPQGLLEQYKISVVPLTIIIDGKQYLEGVDLSPQEFCDKMLPQKNCLKPLNLRRQLLLKDLKN